LAQVTDMGNLTWETFAKLVDMGDPRPSSTAARAVMFAYGFLLLICVNLYTATMAAKVSDPSAGRWQLVRQGHPPQQSVRGQQPCVLVNGDAPSASYHCAYFVRR
jgi:hypothetical protein